MGSLTLTSGITFCASRGRLGTWNLSGPFSEVVRRLSVPVVEASCRWTPAVKEAVRLKKKAFLAWWGLLKQQTGTGRPEGLWLQLSPKQKPEWEEFGEVMEKDFQLASRKFWQTVRRLRKGK